MGQSETLLRHHLDPESKLTSQELGAKFHKFTIEQITKRFSLNDDDLDRGNVDGSNDGGIDAVYLFINDDVVDEGNLDELINQSSNTLEIIIIQSKISKISSKDIINAKNTLQDLLDLEITKADNYEHLLPYQKYNKKLNSQFFLIRRALLAVSSKPNGEVRSSFLYCTLKNSTETSGNARHELLAVKELLKTATYSSIIESSVVGEDELLACFQQPIDRDKTLVVDSKMESNTGDSLIALVTIGELVKFLKDPNKKIDKNLFVINVRAFLGSNKINTNIKDSLKDFESPGDFWWLNNGLAIVAEKIYVMGKNVHLTNPSIVNGMQTSNILFEALDKIICDTSSKAICDRRVIVKMIGTKDERRKREIVLATNSQTSIAPSFLFAMDPVHERIEVHFRNKGLYYERRKAQYRGQNIPSKKIVSIRELTQCMIAFVLLRGDGARARPNDVVFEKENKNIMYSDNVDLDVFLNAVIIKKKLEAMIVKNLHNPGSQLSSNIIWHCLSYIAYEKISDKNSKTRPQAVLVGLKNLVLDDEYCGSVVNRVHELFRAAGGTDQIAKSSEFMETIKEAAREKFEVN